MKRAKIFVKRYAIKTCPERFKDGILKWSNHLVPITHHRHDVRQIMNQDLSHCPKHVQITVESRSVSAYVLYALKMDMEEDFRQKAFLFVTALTDGGFCTRMEALKRFYARFNILEEDYELMNLYRLIMKMEKAAMNPSEGGS